MTDPFSRVGLIGFVVAAVMFGGGCGRDGVVAERRLTVFAAASLGDVFGEIGAAFESRHGIGVACHFAGSGALAQQIVAAPRADVFVSAGSDWLDVVEARGRLLAGSRRSVFSNRLVVVGHAASSWRVDEAGALAALPFRFLAIGDPESVPAGAYAREWMRGVPVEGGASGSLWDAVGDRVSPAPDVRAALAQVEGSVDVIGVVYATDFEARRDVVRLLFAVPPGEGPRIEYGAAVLASTRHEAAALAFLEFLAGPEATAILEAHGFVGVGGRAEREGSP